MPIQVRSVKTAAAKAVLGARGARAATMTDIDRIVNDKAAGIRADAARSMFINTNMLDLPEVYRSQMPTTEDEGALGAAEMQLRNLYREDVKKHLPYQQGYVDVAGVPSQYGPSTVQGQRRQNGQQMAAEVLKRANADGDAVKAEKPPAPPPNLNNMTPTQLFALGLKQEAGQPKQLVESRPSNVQTMPPNYVGMSSTALIALALRGGK